MLKSLGGFLPRQYASWTGSTSTAPEGATAAALSEKERIPSDPAWTGNDSRLDYHHAGKEVPPYIVIAEGHVFLQDGGATLRVAIHDAERRATLRHRRATKIWPQG